MWRVSWNLAVGIAASLRTDRHTSPNLGRARRIDDVQARYIEYAKRTLPRDVSFGGLRVVVDCANGAAYKAAPDALWELGAEVIKIGRASCRERVLTGV